MPRSKKSAKATPELPAEELADVSVVQETAPLVDSSSEQVVPTKKHYHVGRMLAAFGVLVVCSAILGVASMISSAPGPINLSFNSQNLNGLTWQQAEDKIDATAASLVVPISVDEQKINLSAGEAGIRVDSSAWLKTLHGRDADRRSRPWQLLSHENYVPVASFDSKVLESTIRFKGLQTVEPIDASVTIDGDQVQVVRAVDGWGADVGALSAKISADVSDLNVGPIVLPRSATKPKISTAAAEKVAADINAYADKAFSAANGSTPDRATKLAWFDLTPDPDHATITHTINELRITEAVDGMIASVSVTKQDQVDYKMADGSKFTATEGRSAKSVTNKDAIVAAWKAGSDVKLEFKEEQFAVVDGGEFNQWILVDLSALTAYAYVGQTVMNSFPISGGKASTPTPTGTFHIFAKTASQTMCGYYDGYSYSCTPNIKWISWFYPDYALHGAYWHNSFGIANVSHGCINFRNDDSKWIYDWAPVGTPVVVKQG